ncbi:hypothetical protein NQ315_002025 [Exocentrus adspersus]|uniref:Uncharacterized protein n=1 Tax=Exocentrus adspersus TaxID=1586481 RepID=A0AAV8V9D8_9CUCU|nr:hypothetical protein NQ315_002025 [Exocentrus adspersus]
MIVGAVSFILAALLVSSAYANPSVINVAEDMYRSCIRDFSFSCVKPKALQWISDVSNNDEIKITEDLMIVKKRIGDYDNEVERGLSQDIFEKFENFLQNHDLLAKSPLILNPTGPLGSLIPRSFQPSDIKVPLAATGNDLWLGLVRDCDPPTFSCIQNNIYQYLRRTLDYPKDLQFTSFLKFAKNSIDYSKLTVSESVADETPDSDGTAEDDVTPLEEISRSLTENAVKFFTTHDMEVQLPENLFMGTTLKISPKSFEDNGALVKLEVVPKSLSDSVGEGRIFFKKNQ